VEGLFHSDVRHLAGWSLLIDGRPIKVLTTRSVDYYPARVVGTPAGWRCGTDRATRYGSTRRRNP
jgi:hypothetical protein